MHRSHRSSFGRLALVGAAVTLLGHSTGCDKVPDIIRGSPPPPDRIATVRVYDPFEETETDVTVKLPSGASEEVKAAVLHIQNEDYELARQSLDAALTRKPTDPAAHLLLGLVHEYQGNWDRSIDSYKQAVLNKTKENATAREGRKRSEAKKEEGAGG